MIKEITFFRKEVEEGEEREKYINVLEDEKENKVDIFCANLGESEEEEIIRKYDTGKIVIADFSDIEENFGIKVRKAYLDTRGSWGASYGAFWGKKVRIGSFEDYEWHDRKQEDSILFYYEDYVCDDGFAMLEAISLLEKEGLITIDTVVIDSDEDEFGHSHACIRYVSVTPA
jgi:SepF-like predicted cell division protein (DUF552 family)